MAKFNSAIARARLIYFFKETFRARSKAEYKEIFSRGLNEDNGGVSGAFPWLYVRSFFVFLVLFTVNVLVLRLTNNLLYIPSVVFLGGVTFTVPFVVLLFELYPKRDVSLFLILSLLVAGGTVAGVLTQVVYKFYNPQNGWISAVLAGGLEEVCKAIPAIATIALFRQKNAYACYLLAAAVGAGFSVIEDMGYIFVYSDTYFVDINSIVKLFVDRGLSSFCTHVLWTGAIGWAYSYIRKPLKSFRFFLTVLLSIALHICWDFPLDGWWQVLDIAACTIIAAAVNIAILHISRRKTLLAEVDLTAVNEQIIREAKAMGERMRFTNAANLTYGIMWAALCVGILLLCAMPIGTDYRREKFDGKEEFITFLEDGRSFLKSRDREYDAANPNVEERWIESELTYVIQREWIDGYDYYFGYYISNGSFELNDISVEVEESGVTSQYPSTLYSFGNTNEWVFDIKAEEVRQYKYYTDGTVTAVLNAEEFEGYNVLIAICGVCCAVTLSSFVVILGLRLKIRSMKDAE